MPEIRVLERVSQGSIRIAGVQQGAVRPAKVQVAAIEWQGDTWDGTYTFTPADSTQIVPVTNKRMTQDIVIDPIPSNYGLITWNGSTLTVS